MDTSDTFLNSKTFQQLVITIMSIAFGTGLSAAYSIADYMHGVKSRFDMIESRIQTNHESIHAEMISNHKLIQIQLNQEQKQLDIMREFMTKYDKRIRSLEMNN